MPRVTISINAPNEPSDQELLTLDLPPGLTVKDLKGFVEAETSFPATAQNLFLNGRALNQEAQTLEEAGIRDGEMLAVLIRRRRDVAQGQTAAGTTRRPPPDPEALRQHILNDPTLQQDLRERQPELLATIHDPARWRDAYQMRQRQEEQAERERQNQVSLLNHDPFNVDAQRKIEEIIRQDRVIENLQHAYEHNPEVFVRVHMLYIDTEVNGYPVKAFVDSGAQATIMSPGCADRCGLARLLDTRYSGIARGVGTAKILGRVHHAEIKIGGALMPCAFTVMEGKDVDLLFGLDMLKRYKAKIDLEKNCLSFEGIDVPFLPESEIPKNLEEAELNEPTVAGPNGTEIGARSGAVRPAGTTSAAEPSVAASSSSQVQGKPSGAPFVPPVQAQAAPSDGFPEEHIQQLLNLGFSREDAVRALQATNGEVQYAAELLFSRNG